MSTAFRSDGCGSMFFSTMVKTCWGELIVPPIIRTNGCVPSAVDLVDMKCSNLCSCKTKPNKYKILSYIPAGWLDEIELCKLLPQLIVPWTLVYCAVYACVRYACISLVQASEVLCNFLIGKKFTAHLQINNVCCTVLQILKMHQFTWIVFHHF